MSGIAGIIHFDGRPAEHALIEQMTGALAHRGPDGINHWVRSSVALGQCMLRTTPESQEETQPLTNEDESLVLVMDGRVDNWEELRGKLISRGAKLRTRADAELVLRAYEVWGSDSLSHIDGDFSIVMWDERKREAFCARDRIGNKPFNYHFDGRTLAFASEHHAILSLPWIPEIPNEGMIAEIMSDEWMCRDETIWTGINRLVASHWMAFSAKGVRRARYWRPDLQRPLAYKRDEDYFEHYRALLFDIVRRQSRGHVAIACEVSGGLDSSAIFCIAEQLRREGRLQAPGHAGYTLSFQNDAKANEISYARAIGKHFGMPIKEVQPALHDLAWYADIAKKCRDIPGYPNGSMATSLFKAAREDGHRVLLGGTGGDHFLTGSLAYYFEELAEANLAGFIRCFTEDARALGARRATARLIRYGLLPFAPSALREYGGQTLQVLIGEKKRGAYWLSRRMQKILETRRQKFKSMPIQPVRRRGQLGLLLALDYAFDAFGRELWERLISHYALESRQPFLSKEFVEFAFVTPDRLRSFGDQIKLIHRESLKEVLPQMIRQRKTKADFSNVFNLSLQPLGEHLSRQLPEARLEWLDVHGMNRLFDSYKTHPEQGWQNWCLWSVLAVDMTVEPRVSWRSE